MEMTITNFVKQKSINVELPEEMFENIDDLRFIIGTEQFKLISTKTDADRAREKAAVEFGEEVYAELYKTYPDYGKEDCKLTKDDLAKIIQEKLESMKDKYSVLLNDKNPQIVINGLVTAYANYCVVRARIEKEEKEIKESQLDENVFFDYIKRFKKAFEDAKCIKDVHESIVKLHKYAGIDKRELFGYAFIFNCINPFFDKIKEIKTELDGMEPKVGLKDHVIFTDTAYWFDVPMQDIVKQVINNLDELIAKYSNQEDISVSPIEHYARPIINSYRNLVDKQNKLSAYLKEISDETGKINDLSAEQTNKLTEFVDALNEEYKTMIHDMCDLRIRFNVENREMDYNDRVIINANFSLIDFWVQTINETKDNEKSAQINKMIMQFNLHGNILELVIKGKIKSEDLVNGKYSNSDLIKLVEESSK